MIKIQVLQTDTVAQWVEHGGDKPRVLGSNPSKCHIFHLLRSFFLCYPGEALEGQILTEVCKNLTMLIQITTYRYEKLLYIYKNELWKKMVVFADNME